MSTEQSEILFNCISIADYVISQNTATVATYVLNCATETSIDSAQRDKEGGSGFLLPFNSNCKGLFLNLSSDQLGRITHHYIISRTPDITDIPNTNVSATIENTILEWEEYRSLDSQTIEVIGDIIAESQN